MGKESHWDMKNFSIQTIEIKRKTSAIEINLFDAYGSITRKKVWFRMAEISRRIHPKAAECFDYFYPVLVVANQSYDFVSSFFDIVEIIF